MKYVIQHVSTPPPMPSAWDASPWDKAQTASICNFHPRSSDHRPQTECRILFDDSALHVLFRVADRYVRAINTAYQDPVSKDSCVEFFAQPRGIGPYFNFEANCIGTKLVSFIEDHRRVPGGFAKRTWVPDPLGETVVVSSSLDGPIDPEMAEPCDWQLQMRIPFAVFEEFVEPLGSLSGQTWRGNAYKCGDNTSHPHWGAWAPIGEELNFHQPDRFGDLYFA